MPASYWLLKSEPDVYSIDDMARDKRTFWNGVRAYPPRGHLQKMKVGDLALFYHSNADPPGVAGVVKVVKEASPDPTQFDKKGGEAMGYDPKATKEKPIWFGVDVAFVEKLPRVVSLVELKKEPRLKEMKLLKVSRLSVSPVTAAEWRFILAMSREAPKDSRKGKAVGPR